MVPETQQKGDAMAKKVGSVELVSFDAMFTIFTPRKWGRKKLICKIYRESGGLHSSVTNAQIIKTVSEARHKARGFRGDDDYWMYVNLAVLRALPRIEGARGELECAIGIHERLISGDLYKADLEVLRFAKFLKTRGIRIAIASNHRQTILLGLLKKHGIDSLFDVVYTSESIGQRKPFAEFWQNLLTQEGVQASACVHVGNSPNSDGSAALYGIQTMLWDPMGLTAQGIKAGDTDLPDVEPENVADFRVMLRNARLITTVGSAARAKKAIAPRLKQLAHV